MQSCKMSNLFEKTFQENVTQSNIIEWNWKMHLGWADDIRLFREQIIPVLNRAFDQVLPDWFLWLPDYSRGCDDHNVTLEVTLSARILTWNARYSMLWKEILDWPLNISVKICFLQIRKNCIFKTRKATEDCINPPPLSEVIKPLQLVKSSGCR